MTILIISKEHDLHVSAVEWGLRKLGCEVSIWNWGEFPHSAQCRWNLNAKSFFPQDIWINDLSLGNNVNVVWNRRFGVPTPTVNSHEDDYELIKKESLTFLRSTLRSIGNANTKWINPLLASIEADYKIQQLVHATQVELNVPETYVGNDPEELLNFYLKHNKKIIFKAFNPGGWYKKNGSTTVLKTARVLEEHLSCKEAIRACPAIYQPLIDKEFEVRVTVIGDQIWAGKIVADNTCVDWRYDSSQACHKVTYFDLPSEIGQKCIKLCRAMSLEFGCIDLIYSKSGHFIFLEINEAGQFLWKELADPKISLLDTFCRFLAASELPELALRNQPTILFKDYFDTEEYKVAFQKIITTKRTSVSFFPEET